MAELYAKRQANEKFDSIIKPGWYIPEEDFNFISVPYQRAIASTHVNKILKRLQTMDENGETPHFNEPFVVNVRSKSKVVLLDGYHRWEAMKKFGQRVKVKIEIYNKLSPEEEKTLYEDYNIGKKHTVLDLIRPIINKNPALKYLIENCSIPLTIYVYRKKGIPLNSFLLGYKQQMLYTDKKRVRKSLYDFIMKDFNKDDAVKLTDWSQWYVNIAGEYHHKSDYYNRTFMSVMMYVYWNTLRLDRLETRLRDFRFDAEIRQIINTSTGYTGIRALLPAVKERINKKLRHAII